MADTEVRVTGLRALEEKFKGMAKRGKNLRPVLGLIDELLDAHVDKVFETQGAHGGRSWPGLRPLTIKARANRWGHYRRPARGGAGASGPILQWTQGLRRSWRKRGRHHIRILTKKSLRWGSEHPNVAFHQKGSGRRERKMLRFRNRFQRREITVRPISMWIMGVPIGAIRTVMKARTGR